MKSKAGIWSLKSSKLELNTACRIELRMERLMKYPTVIILASGRGERFVASGGTIHKLQSLLSGKTVLQHTLEAVIASGLPWHIEDAGHPGMGDSIAAGVAATQDALGWLILPADLPLIKATTIRVVAQNLLNASVVVPTYQGERGHPVGFGTACKEDLLSLSGNSGAASVVKKHHGKEFPVNDMGIRIDIDTLQDLHRAEAHYRSTLL
jgi:molybdenum cofactor cytidylyltransferase